MSQATSPYYADPAIYGDDPYAQDYAYETTAPVAAPHTLDYPRSNYLWLWFLIPLALCGISYAGDGQPFVTDVGMISLTVICCLCFLRELIVFPKRFGVGGLILFGGTVLWFCYDYIKHWMGFDFGGSVVEPWVVAKSAYFHAMFVLFMVLGLYIRRGRWLERVLQIVPEANSKNLMFAMVLITFFLGMIPFLFFAQENFFEAIWKSLWSGRAGGGASFTVGRGPGNVNYKWGAYVERLSDVGMLGAILAGFYATIVTKQLWQQIVCWTIWALWVGLAFGTGSRGFTVFVAMPVVILIFLKYSHQASLLLRKVSFRAYVVSALVGASVLLLIQVQGAFRNEGFTTAQFKEVEVTELEGNEMFTTTLVGMRIFPKEEPFFYNKFPGQGFLYCMPYEIFYLVIGPIPRALWHNKPLDYVNVWYNNRSAGTRGVEGTTVSNGAVGHPYIRFGWAGVLQLGLLYGWMMAVVERTLKQAMGRPMAMLITLAFATFIFRSFRDLWWHNLYPIIIAGVVLWVLVKIANTLFGSDEQYAVAA